MKKAVILPCYNVEKNVEKVIDNLIDLKKRRTIDEIIAIDDGSKDQTPKILRKFNQEIIIITHKENAGKGKSIDDGVNLAIKRKIDYLVFFDADGEHDISVIKPSLEILKKCDVVFGSRFRETKEEEVLVGRMLMAQVFACLLERLFSIKTTDPYCGFKAIRTTAYKKISPTEKRYNLELEMLIKSKIKKLKCREIKIPLLNVVAWKRKFEEENQNSVSDFASWIDAQVRVIKKVIKEENYLLDVKLK